MTTPPTYHDHAYRVLKTRIGEVIEHLRELRIEGGITEKTMMREVQVVYNFEGDLDGWFRDDKSVDGLAELCEFHSKFIQFCDVAGVLWDHVKFYWGFV